MKIETENNTKTEEVTATKDQADMTQNILHQAQTPQEKNDLNVWMTGFFKRYDQALRNLAK